MDSQTLQYDHWPLRDEWKVSVPLLAVLIIVAVSAAISVDNPLMGLGVLLALAVCTWEMWLPSNVQIDGTGVRVHPPLGTTKWLPWPNVAVCEVQRRGFLFKTTDQSVPLSIRGIFVRSGSHHEELLELIRIHHPQCLGERDELSFDVKLPGDAALYGELPSTHSFPDEEPTTKSKKAPVDDDPPIAEDSQAS